MKAPAKPTLQPPLAPINGCLLVKCTVCKFVWAAFFTPFPASEVHKACTKTCIRCGRAKPSQIAIAAKSDEAAYAQHLRDELARIETPAQDAGDVCLPQT